MFIGLYTLFPKQFKGELEKDIITLNFEATHIFRPSMILGKRKEKRFMENILQEITKIVSPLFKGTWSKYRGMKASDIAKAIVNSADGNTKENVKIYFWEDMSKLLMK